MKEAYFAWDIFSINRKRRAHALLNVFYLLMFLVLLLLKNLITSYSWNIMPNNIKITDLIEMNDIKYEFKDEDFLLDIVSKCITNLCDNIINVKFKWTYIKYYLFNYFKK